MQRIALIGRDNMLLGRVQAAAAGLGAVSLLSADPVEFPPQIAALKPMLVLVELEGGQTPANLPRIMASIAAVDPALQVVVIGDSDNAADVLAAVRAGSIDFIDREEPIAILHDHLKRRFATLTEVERGEPGEFSVVLNAQPGGGAGLFALNLAIVRALRHQDALLIDCHLPVSEAGAALDIALSYSLADAARDTGRLDRTLLLSAMAQHAPSGLRVLPLSMRVTDDIGLSSESCLKALRAIRPLFSETVLNAGGIRDPMLLHALSQWASTVYLVCPQKFTALRDARDMLATLPVGFDAVRRVVLIVDEFSPNITLSPEQMLATLGLERVIALPAARDELLNGLNIGRPYVLSRPRAPYTLAIHAAVDGHAAEAAPKLGGIVLGIGKRLRGVRA